MDCKRINPGVDKLPTTNGPVRMIELGVSRFPIVNDETLFEAVLRRPIFVVLILVTPTFAAEDAGD